MTAPRPWMKFNPQRWRSDPALRLCSAATRGVWIELICLMHLAEPYGHLLVKGQQPSVRQLAVLAGVTLEEVSAAIIELEQNDVFSRTEDGTIFSRAMVRDEERHVAASQSGTKGARRRYQKSNGKTGPYRGGNGVADGDAHEEPNDSEFREQSSVSKDTAAEAANSDPVKALFDDGVRYLGSCDIKPGRARGLIGLWRKEFSDEEVAAGLIAAEAENISDPASWVPRHLAYERQRQPKTRSYADVVLEEAEREARRATAVTPQ